MAVLDRPKASDGKPQIWPLSVKAYHALGEMGLIPEKTELLYGQVYQKMPKSPFHAFLILRLMELLRKVLPSGFHILPEQPMECRDSEPEPDLAVIHGSVDDFAAAHPRTAEPVVEVCVSSYEYDRLKLRAYAQAEVKEVWLVLGPERRIEIHRRPSGDHFEDSSVYGPGEVAVSTVIPAFVVDVARLFQT